jgi:hypothetical protein
VFGCDVVDERQVLRHRVDELVMRGDEAHVFGDIGPQFALERPEGGRDRQRRGDDVF